MLSSLLGRDNYLPHQLANRGDRLVFSNGIVLLALVAVLLIVAFNADVTRLIQLYILGVFLSFTLSQAGMVRHWSDLIGHARAGERRALRRKQAVNGLGAVATAVVFVIVLVTKFAQGAWIVVVAAPILFAAMKAIVAPLRAGSASSWPRRRPGWRCRGGSTPSSWSRTCSRRRCGRSRSPRRPSPATLRAVKVAAEEGRDRWPRNGASAGCPCRWW